MTMTSTPKLSAADCVPRDASALLIGRAWIPVEDGPSVIAVRGDEAVDLTREYPTVSHLLNIARPDELRTAIKGAPVAGRLDDIVSHSRGGHRDPARPVLLAPPHLPAVQAGGLPLLAGPPPPCLPQ